MNLKILGDRVSSMLLFLVERHDVVHVWQAQREALGGLLELVRVIVCSEPPEFTSFIAQLNESRILGDFEFLLQELRPISDLFLNVLNNI